MRLCYRHRPDCRVTTQLDDDAVLDLDEVEFPTGSRLRLVLRRRRGILELGHDPAAATKGQGRFLTGGPRLVPKERLPSGRSGRPGSPQGCSPYPTSAPGRKRLQTPSQGDWARPPLDPHFRHPVPQLCQGN